MLEGEGQRRSLEKIPRDLNLSGFSLFVLEIQAEKKGHVNTRRLFVLQAKSVLRGKSDISLSLLYRGVSETSVSPSPVKQ